MPIFDLLKGRVSSLDILNHKDVHDDRSGVTPGGFHHDPDGDAWYVKHHTNPHQAWTEHVANQLYRAAGHNAPHSMVLHDHEHKPVYFSKEIKGFKTVAASGASGGWEGTGAHRSGDHEWAGMSRDFAHRHLKGLAADYLVHATDMHTSNVGHVGGTHEGTPTRIDNGGAFHINAYGSTKYKHDLDASVVQYADDQNYHAVQRAAGSPSLIQHGEPGHGDRYHIHNTKLREVTSPAAMRGQVKNLAKVRQQHGGWEGFVEHHAAGAPAHLKKIMVDHLNERHERLLKHVLPTASTATPSSHAAEPGYHPPRDDMSILRSLEAKSAARRAAGVKPPTSTHP